MERNELIFQGMLIVVASFVGAMASQIWSELSSKYTGLKFIMIFFGYFCLFSIFTLIIVFILSKRTNLI